MFNIKTYTYTDTYKSTINPDIIKNVPTFSAQINGWLWNLRLSLDIEIDNTDYEHGDIVRVFNRDNLLIYAGKIDFINKTATNFEEIELIINGIYSYLGRSVYDTGGDFALTLSWDAKELIDNAIDDYNAENWADFPIIKQTELFGVDIKYEVSYATNERIIRDVANTARWYYYYLDENNNFVFREKWGEPQHIITFKKDIFELYKENDSTQLYNRLWVKWKVWDGIGASPEQYNDLTSQAIYGIREKFIDNQNLDNLDAVDEFWAKFLEENAVPKRSITLQVSSDYKYQKFLTFDDLATTSFDDLATTTFDELFENQSIDTMKPWDILKIRNLKIDFWNLLIAKKDYNPYTTKLYLDYYDNFIELIK